MTSLLILLLLGVLCCTGSFLLGWYLRETKEAIKELREKLSKTELPVGATLGAYAPVNEFRRTNQAGEVGLVESKTPQRVEFEAQEALRRESRGE